MGDDVAFDEAINSGQHLGPWTACTICDLSSMCFYETCHNDGHWVEVDFPDTGGQTGTAGLASCRDQCISHSEATAFQFNDDGWCGCMVLDGDISFADAVGGEHGQAADLARARPVLDRVERAQTEGLPLLHVQRWL